MTAHSAEHEHALDTHKVGMLAFLVSEVAFFSTLIVAYLTFIDQSRPTAKEVLSLTMVLPGTFCLLLSSLTVHLAVGALEKKSRAAFLFLWLVTIGLGIGFLVGTAVEWHELIVTHRITIATNLFGTTYYTLVGFHALHVTIGVVLLILMFYLAFTGHVQSVLGPELISWYWHFVDVVWVIVFFVVYVFGTGLI